MTDATSLILADRRPEDRALAKQAKADLDRCQPTLALWQKSHSEFTWTALTIGGEHTPIRRLRQVAAELQRKQDALAEAGFEVRKRIAEAKCKREQAAKMDVGPADTDFLLLEAEELETKAEMVRRPYLGCLRDVTELAKLHDQIKAQVGELTQEKVEADEARYWVIRSLRQSLRDIRERGRITKGEQELLEQIGLDPEVVHKMLCDFLSKTQDQIAGTRLDSFMASAAEQMAPLVLSRVKHIYQEPPHDPA